MTGLNFPDRDQWARSRQTVYLDDVDEVLDNVSADPAGYATRAEILQAADELGEYWRKLGREVREANRAATAVFPLHGSRHRKRGAVLAVLAVRDKLSPGDLAVVEHAEALRHHRQLVNDAVDQLTGEHPRLHGWTVTNAQKWMPATACPTWRGIVARWRSALAKAEGDYREEVAQRPVDTAAWRKELRRRVEIETWSLDKVRRCQ